MIYSDNIMIILYNNIDTSMCIYSKRLWSFDLTDSAQGSSR